MISLLDACVAGLLTGGVLFAYSDTLVAMAHHWSESPMYSYAYTVPAISLFLLWSRRNEFKVRRLEPARALGLVALAGALAMFVVGDVGTIRLLQQLAFLVALGGIVLLLFGIQYFKVALPALGYLLFMVPFWDVFTEPLHEPFQHNSARLGVALLQPLGIPVFREGTFIWLPNVAIEVARACSGVNYLVAVLALALPLSYLRLRSNWRRLLLIGASMLIAALANGVRVALISGLSYFGMTSALHGPFHVLHGLFVAAIGYIALFAGLRLLQTDEGDDHRQPPPHPTGARPRWRTAEAGILAGAFWILGVVGVAPAAARVALVHPLDDLPSQLGEWFNVPARSTDAQAQSEPWAGADHHLHRRYQGAEGIQASIDVWYFESQRQNHEVISFKVEDLHRHASSRQIAIPGQTALKANAVVWPERGQVGLFWYDIGGVVESDPMTAKARSLWSALVDGRTNGAAIMLRAPASSGSEDRALDALDKLAVQLHEKLSRHWSRGGGPAPTAGGVM